MNVLVLDDEEFIRIVLQQALREEGCHVTLSSSGKEALSLMTGSSFDCVITDLRMPDMDGLEMLRWVRDRQPDVDVVLLTGHGDIQTAVEAMRAEAVDFLVKETPFDGSQVKAAVRRLQTLRALRKENLALRHAAAGLPATDFIPGISPCWQALMAVVEKVAPSQAPVLIQGETGSGKEVVARKLHALSTRRDGPFLALNCGAMGGDLLAAELFGHEKGAYTGAHAAKQGLIAAADGGTLFLDEISEMSGSMQTSLLRVLDRGEYRQVGGTRVLQANVRFVGASNQDLQGLVLKGRFRDDLLYRLNTITLSVPPLRERRDDIPHLANHFLHTMHLPGIVRRELSPEAIEALAAYAWPGNVRELRNVVERVLLLSEPDTQGPINRDEVTGMLLPSGGIRSIEQTDPGSLEEAEKQHIRRVLDAQGGNKTQAARLLRIDYKTLLAKLRRYNITS